MRSTLLAIAILLPAISARADELEMPGETVGTSLSKPSKGSTMKAVLHAFGAPTKKYAPVGGGSVHQPPITRWDYPSFSVFFENSHVVDAVVPGSPPALQRSEELQSSPR